jgi:hypothetical protein
MCVITVSSVIVSLYKELADVLDGISSVYLQPLTLSPLDSLSISLDAPPDARSLRGNAQPVSI